MEAELKGDLLVGTRAFPDGHRKLDRLEIEEGGRAAVGGEIGGRAHRVEENGFVQRVLFDEGLFGVEEFVGHAAQVSDALFCQLPALRGRELGQPIHRILARWVGPVAVIAESASKGDVTVSPDADRRLGGLSRHALSLGHPTADLVRSCKRFRRQVGLGEQASVVFFSRINPRAVDARQHDGLHCDARSLSDEGLHGDVFAVIVLHAGGRLHLHHPPSTFAVFNHRQHHICKRESASGLETGLENRLRRIGQQPRGASEGCVEALRFYIDDVPFLLGIIDAACNVAHLIADLEAR